MREIIENFFIPIAKDSNFDSKANGWIKKQSEFPWDTSILKVIDNLVIGIGLISKEKKKRNKKA